MKKRLRYVCTDDGCDESFVTHQEFAKHVDVDHDGDSDVTSERKWIGVGQ